MNNSTVNEKTCGLITCGSFKCLKMLCRLTILTCLLLPTKLFADAFIQGVDQSPDNPVSVGETVNYKLFALIDFLQIEFLDNSSASIIELTDGAIISDSSLASVIDLPNERNVADVTLIESFDVFISTAITVNGVLLGTSLDSSDGKCSFNGRFSCGELEANVIEDYSFSWTPSVAGTYEITFILSCQFCASSATTTISTIVVDEDPPDPGVAQFDNSDISVSEGETAIVNINRIGGSDGELTVDFLVGGTQDTAISGVDYQPPETNRVIFADGETMKQVPIVTLEDALVEGTERINVLRVLPEGTVIFEQTIFIQDNTQPGQLAFDTATSQVSEGEDLVLTVVRTGGSAGNIGVDIILGDTDDSSSIDDIVVPESLFLAFADGVTSRSLTIPIRDDGVAEGDEVLTARLQAVCCDAALEEVGEPSVQRITIIDDAVPMPGNLRFSTASAEVSEGATVTLVVERIDGSDGQVFADLVFGNEADSASNDDYRSPTETRLFFEDGETMREFDVVALTDGLSEGTESLSIMLVDDQDSPASVIAPEVLDLEISDVNLAEAGLIEFTAESFAVDEDAGEIEIVARRINGADGRLEVDVQFGAEDDTAVVGENYSIPNNTRLVWTDGDVADKSLRIEVFPDGIVGPQRQLSLALVAVGDTLLGPVSEATLLISNTDDVDGPSTIPELEAGLIEFTAESFAVDEDAGEIEIVARRINGADGRLEVDVLFGAEDDTAVLGENYSIPNNTRLVWTDGDVADKSLRIEVFPDDTVGPQRQLSLALVAVGDAMLGPVSEATLLISNTDLIDDPASVQEFNIISGDNQSGGQGEVLEPLIVSALDSGGEPVSGILIEWIVTPESAATFQAGPTTSTDDDGATSNTVILNTDQFVVVTARALGATTEPATFRINGLIPTDNLSRNQVAVLDGLSMACDAIDVQGQQTIEQADLSATCDLLPTLDTPDELLDLLAPDEVAAQGVSLIQASNLQVMNVRTRLNVLRSGGRGVDVGGISLTVDGVPIPSVATQELLSFAVGGGGASSDAVVTDYSRFGAFFTGEFSIGSRDRTSNENGFDFRATTITGGIDYRLASDVVAGLAVGYGSGNSDFDTDTGDLDKDSFHITGYGTWYYKQQLYVDGVIEYGAHDFTSSRRVSLPGFSLQRAQGDTDGDTLSLSVSAGYDVNFQALSLGTYGRFVSTNADIDAYDESAEFEGVDGIGSILNVGSQSIDSLTFAVGLEATYAISLANGVIQPQARLEFEHESSDDQREINVRFLADPTNTIFTLLTDEPDRNYLNLGLGFSAIGADGKSAFFFYETRLSQDNLQQQWLRGGIRFEF